MMIFKSEIEKVQYGFLHDALLQISRIVPGFMSCYMDKQGELAINFDRDLTLDEIKGVLFELHPFSRYDAAPVGPSAEEVEHGRDFAYRAKGMSVYSRDGIDYRKVDEMYQY